MSKVAIMTDSNSGITQAEGKELGIFVIPMPFIIDGETYYEDISLSQAEFYTKLKEDTDISTTQPAPGDTMDMWKEILETYDEIVYIPMSSGLSGTCHTALMLANEDDFEGKVFVVDNQRISVTMKQSVFDAKYMAKQGMSAKQIHDVLMDMKMESSIYIMLDTLKYLKRVEELHLPLRHLEHYLSLSRFFKFKEKSLMLLQSQNNRKCKDNNDKCH